MKNSSPTLDQASLVPTRSLPEGALFVAQDGIIYQVILAGSAGFRKAKRWGGTDRDAVALVPDSPLAYHYPVMEHGLPLPRLKRFDLTNAEGLATQFYFPTEKLARTAAHLDEVLAWQSGCVARKENARWLMTDGLHHFRVYHYQESDDGEPIDLKARFEAENIESLPFNRGPDHWAYLPGAGFEEPITEEPVAEAPVPEAPVADAPVPEPPAPVASAPDTATPEMTSEDLEQDSSFPMRELQLSAQKGENMIISIDIGYGYTKGVGPDGWRFSFPSVIGNAEEIAFTSDLIVSQTGPTVGYGGRRFFYGEQALLQSRLRTAIFDRSRTRDETYRLLFVSSLAEFARYSPQGGKLNVVTGLPVAFFADRDDVVISLAGEYRIKLEDTVVFDVEHVYVVPQPFGSLFRELLSEGGVISNVDVEHGRVAVIDVGTFTTDFIVADALRYVQRFSGSVPLGWSEALNYVQRELSSRYRLDLTLHEVDKAIRNGSARVKGEPISLEPLLAAAVRELEMALVAKARDLWGEGVNLDAMLITGGAAPQLAGAIQSLYPQARLVPDSFWANAEGFYRFGQRPAIFNEAQE
jgi:plasmid segregation protein ParM